MTSKAWSPPPPLSREQTASMNRQRLAVAERAGVMEEAEKEATAVRENMARLRELSWPRKQKLFGGKSLRVDFPQKVSQTFQIG
jgi:hypothetical protein